ncbi:MAG: hypothetical protein JW741_01615 [Sedimentisphaerales bacterium]|nr:hypothetical protein [Sedimentisphaerales bacterium]
MRQWIWVIVLGVLVFGLPLRAEFNLMEDFDVLPTGPIDGVQSTAGGVWDTAPEDSAVQNVSLLPGGGPTDKALTVRGSSVHASHLDVGDPAIVPHTWIENTETGTFFCRFYQPAEGRVYHMLGMTDVIGDLETVSWAYWRTGVYVHSAAAGQPKTMYTVNASGALGDPIASIEGDTWCNIWFVANQVNDTFDVYLTTGRNAASESDLVVGGLSFLGVTPWSLPLTGMNVRGHTGSTDLYIDDIYWDGSGKNLENPAALVAAHDPSPANGAENVAPGAILSWTLGDDPFNDGTPNPGIYQQDVWFSVSPGSQTLEKIAQLGGTATAIDPAAYGKTLVRDAEYYWRIDTHAWVNDPNFYEGEPWMFEMEPTAPIMTADPVDTLADIDGDAQFAVAAYNPFTGDGTGLGFQWYKVGDPDDVALSDGADFSGATMATLTVFGVQVADEGDYYCEVELLSNNATVTSQAAHLETKRLVAHWTFNGTYDDATASGFDADPNGVVQYVEGVVSPAANGAVQIAAESGWATAGTWDPSGISEQLSITAWVKPDVGNLYGTIISKREEWTNMRWTFRMNNTREVIFFDNGNNVSSEAQLEVGAWNHVAAIFDGTGAQGVARVYVNGVLAGENTSFELNPGVDTTVRIGHSDAAISRTWPGALDDLRVYNYVLDELAIADQYYTVSGEKPCLYPIDAAYDHNGDCKVDLVDFESFAANWLLCGLYPTCVP